MCSSTNLHRYVLAQPWFATPGHAAQSLIRTYRAISSYLKPEVWVYIPHDDSEQTAKLHQLNTLCNGLNLNPRNSWQQRLLHPSIAGIHLMIIHLAKISSSKMDKINIFFIDANLHILSLLIIFYKPKIYKLDVLCMVSPNFYRKGKSSLTSLIKWYLVRRLFDLPYFHLHLRTEELSKAWKRVLPCFSRRIGYLPSLELQGSKTVYDRFDKGTNFGIDVLKNFLILGQIRSQKSVEDIFNIFYQNPILGNLTIAGKIVDDDLRNKLFNSIDRIVVNDNFLSESEIEDYFIHSDYNLMLYKDWDENMESSMLYESLKYTCPIVAYKGGWLGNRVENYGLGWLIHRDSSLDSIKNFISSIPSPSSDAYRRCLTNLNEYYAKISSSEMTDIFLQTLNWKLTT